MFATGLGPGKASAPLSEATVPPLLQVLDNATCNSGGTVAKLSTCRRERIRSQQTSPSSSRCELQVILDCSVSKKARKELKSMRQMPSASMRCSATCFTYGP
uniref:Hypothetical unspecified product n=1 Tax=Leishmania guyanensis TaxID=5670 RepID=A0A1E1IWU2_LEIGU